MYVSVAYFGFLPGFRGHDPIQGTEGAPLFFYLFIGGLILGLPLAMWRIRVIQQVFEESVEVPGQITDISFFRDRGTVRYSYTYQGRAYAGTNAIMKTAQTRDLNPGDQAVLLVNPNEPGRALIRDLYV